MKQTKLVKLTEAVREYGIPKTTFEIAVKNRELTVYSFRDKDRYFMRAELDRWIETKMIKPEPLIKFNRILKSS